jgi:hypothetical protein
MDYVIIWTGISTIGMIVFGYLNYRKAEVITFAMEVVAAYADKTITEEEYSLIVEKLKLILYKK